MATTPPDADNKDPYDGEYIGNIFGWKISMIGLAVILFFTALAAYRHYSLDVPIGFDDPLESEEEKSKYAPAPNRSDTTQINNN
ncbi:hypothetical protein A3850_013245 [Lewinella sp. 4G2]|nr:hypothetical protein A3850_013245 [Lewinella sp. 4G2]